MRIVLTGGGTLGPVTPLLAVAAAIKAVRPECAFSWIGTEDGPEGKFVAAAGMEFHAVSSGKLRRYASWQNLTDPFRIVVGYFQSRRLLKKLAPDVVVSAGGFVAVPVTWAAGHLGIPVHIHQQDIRPGLANKLSLPHAASVSVAFEKSLADFPGKNAVWTGNPVRPSLFTGSKERAEELWGIEPGLPVILAVGGGTGSATLNDLVRGAAPLVADHAQVIHLAGVGKASGMVPQRRYRQIEFLSDDMRHAYAAADLVVTRAGMGVLTELAALGLPAVIVPIHGSHQEDNATFFAKSGAAIEIAETGATAEFFAEALLALLADRPRLEAMSKAMKALTKPDAAQKAAEMVLGLTGGDSSAKVSGSFFKAT